MARTDFAIPDLKIAIEAHSRRFHFGDNREDDDAVREAKMQAQGWIVRYVTNAQARNPRSLGNSVRALVSARRTGVMEELWSYAAVVAACDQSSQVGRWSLAWRNSMTRATEASSRCSVSTE